MPVPPPDLLLCDHCGYPLPGLDDNQACPECGTPASASNPARRSGPLWATRPGLGTWIDVVLAMLFRPAAFFRNLRLGGSNLLPRLFLLSIACIVGAAWAIGEAVWGGRPAPLAWALGMAAAKAVLILSYIEAGGVTFFSRQRGWRVPFRLAERVVCYAAVGWLPAAAGLIVLNAAWRSGALADIIRPAMNTLGVPTSSGLPAGVFPAVFVAVGGLLILGFEAWVYVGVRRVRFANPPGARPTRTKSTDQTTSDSPNLDAPPRPAV